MAITMKDVRKWLDPDEVDYVNAKKLGPAALPHLLELVQGGDLGLASKATYLASLIKGEGSSEVLEIAAGSKEPILRVAAASGIRNLSAGQALKVVDLLMNDPDAGVRKVLLKSAARFRSRQMVTKLTHLAKSDPEPFVRDLAASTVKKIQRKRG
jgi:HEAT repeat protein